MSSEGAFKINDHGAAPRAQQSIGHQGGRGDVGGCTWDEMRTHTVTEGGWPPPMPCLKSPFPERWAHAWKVGLPPATESGMNVERSNLWWKEEKKDKKINPLKMEDSCSVFFCFFWLFCGWSKLITTQGPAWGRTDMDFSWRNCRSCPALQPWEKHNWPESSPQNTSFC